MGRKSRRMSRQRAQVQTLPGVAKKETKKPLLRQARRWKLRRLQKLHPWLALEVVQGGDVPMLSPTAKMEPRSSRYFEFAPQSSGWCMDPGVNLELVWFDPRPACP